MSVRRVVRAYLLSIVVWSLLSLLTAYQSRIFDIDWKIQSTLPEMILLSETRGLAFAVLSPPIFYLVRRLNGRPLKNLLIYAVLMVPFMVLYATIRWVLLRPWVALLHRYIPAHGPFGLIRSGFADQIMIYIAIVAAAHAYVYFMERIEYQRALAASELQALKMQLHPHFLFNTLNGISILIDSDANGAKWALMKLSTLLRTALDYSGSDLVSLQEEVRFVREYLDLEMMRFGPRLKVIWNVSPDTWNLQVPQFILQPLVENAIRHGIASSRDAGWLEISSGKSANGLDLCVRNSVGPVHHQSKGSGVGLRNTEARLRHLFSGEAELSFAVSEERTATTAIHIPALGVLQ